MNTELVIIMVVSTHNGIACKDFILKTLTISDGGALDVTPEIYPWTISKKTLFKTKLIFPLAIRQNLKFVGIEPLFTSMQYLRHIKIKVDPQLSW